MECRHDAALFYADKALTLSQTVDDALSLAYIHFSNREFKRCLDFLDSNAPLFENNTGPALEEHWLVLRSRCHYSMGQFEEASDTLDTFSSPSKSAQWHLLKGQVCRQLGMHSKASDYFQQALLVDSQCIEALQELTASRMLTHEQERILFERASIKRDFGDHVLAKTMEFLFKCQLHQVKVSPTADTDLMQCAKKYRLDQNGDVLCALAETYMARFDYRSSLDTVNQVLSKDAWNQRALLIKCACLYELKQKTPLFKLGHQLVKHYPKKELTWYAVAVYYLLQNKHVEARKYFSQVTTLNPSMAEGWIGFGHSFALDGENDQALSAYATASRLFPGNHMPKLFMGMQYSTLGQFQIAKELLIQAHKACAVDPVLLNELGVVCLGLRQFKPALAHLVDALKYASHYDLNTQATIHMNLGHAYRHMEHWHQAQDHYQKAMFLAPNSVQPRVCLGMTKHFAGDSASAIQLYHEALALDPQNSIASELLDRVMQDSLSNISLWELFPSVRTTAPTRHQQSESVATAFPKKDLKHTEQRRLHMSHRSSQLPRRVTRRMARLNDEDSMDLE